MSDTAGYFKVTGVRTNGRRFKAIKTTNLAHALCINLYRGSVWRVRPDGRYSLIKRVWN